MSANVRIIHSPILGGWLVVRGPSRFPLSTVFKSKADAQAWLDKRRER